MFLPSIFDPMKKLVSLFILIMLSLSIIAQTEPQEAPLNPDFVQYSSKLKSLSWPTVTEDGHGLGLIPSPFQYSFAGYRTKKLAFPASYDLRTLGFLTPVKDQGSCGSCWTFATYGSVESSWKKLGLGDFDLSEDNLNNCHKFDWLACEGGNSKVASAYMARRSGPIYESDDSYSGTSGAGYCPSGLSPVAYITDVRFVPNDMNAIKQALMDYGALYTDISWQGTAYDSKTKTFYYNGTAGTNHAVLLVGWDDNKVVANAPSPGAWIIRNSWGTTWGEQGFFYVSYSDTKVNSEVAYYPTRINMDQNSQVYNYDDLGQTTSYGYAASTAYGMVKYTTSAAQQITKIGTWAVAANTVLDIEIYDDFNGTTLSNKLASISGLSCPLPGYYSFNLTSPLNMASGNDFYIKIKYNTPGYNYPIPCEKQFSGYSSKAVIETAKCWISSAGTSWSVVGTGTSSVLDVCIKAYAGTGNQTATPSAVTSAVTGLSSTGATLNGMVNAKTVASTVIFEYGTTTAYGQTIAATPSAITGSTNTTVSAALTGLTANVTYNYRVKVTYGTSSTVTGNNLTFTTNVSNLIPVPVTYDALDLSATTARLKGRVNPKNSETTVVFEYGTTTAYGSSVATDQGKINGAKDSLVYTTLGALTPNTIYHYRVKATNQFGTATGADKLFMTKATVSLPFSESFGGTSIPSGWYQMMNITDTIKSWSISLTSEAGGTANEMVSKWQDVNNGTVRFVTPAINTVGISTVILKFKHLLDDFGPGATLKIQSSKDGITWDDEPWSLATVGDNLVGPETVRVMLTKNINSATTQIAFVVTGNLYQYDYWYIDDVTVSGALKAEATTADVTNITATGATLNGFVYANGASTTVTFDYGTTTAYGSSGTVTGTVSGVTKTLVSSAITGLTPKTVYHYRVKCVNSIGTSYSTPDMTFTTNGPNAPLTVSADATAITASSATLNGTVTANGLATTVSFDYGLTPAFDASWKNLNWNPINVTGTTATNVNLTISGLAPGKIYYFRVNANNSDGTTYGAIKTFTTLVSTSKLNFLALKAQSVAGTYTDLGVNGTAIATANTDDAISAPVNIGFTFGFDGQTFTQFILSTNGFIKLGNTPTSKTSLYFDSETSTTGGIFNSADPQDVFVISPFNYDLFAGTGTTEFRAYTSGVAGSKVCTIQFSNLQDFSSSNQFSNLSFQIKLYEGTNVIEYVYGPFTASINAESFQTAGVGLKGSDNTASEILVATKASYTDWASVEFVDGNYSVNSHNFKNSFPPSLGRTYRFTPMKANDLGVNEIYTLAKLPIPFGNPHIIKANIVNNGTNTATNVTVTLNVTGANTFTSTAVIASLATKDNKTVEFAAFSPTAVGTNTITITLPTDDDITSNTKTISQTVNNDTYSNSIGTSSSGSYGFNKSAGLLLTKYVSNAVKSVTAVNAFISNYSDNTNNKVFAVVVDNTGKIIGRSDTVTLLASDLGKMKTFTIKTPPTILSTEFYVGLGQTANTTTGYYPLGYQTETPNRPGAFYSAASSAGTLYPTDFNLRYQIDAVMGSSTALPVCVTSEATDITTTGAILNGTVNANGLSTTITFEWGLTTAYGSSLNANPATSISIGDIGASAGLTGLALNTLYHYRVKAVNGVGTTLGLDKTFTTGTTAIHDLDDKTVNIYPNPSNGLVYINFNQEGFSTVSLKVFNAIGELVYERTAMKTNGTISLSLENLHAGIYAILVQGEKKSIRKTLVIQK